MVLNLNQAYVHIIDFCKIYIIFTLVLEKDTVLLQLCVEQGNGFNVPFVIKCTYLSLNKKDPSHIFLKQCTLIGTC